MEFKGTKGKLERKYVSGVCIGIGTVGQFSQITANSILPDTDEEYEVVEEEIEANMLLYSKAPEMLEMLQDVVELFEQGSLESVEPIKRLIKEATEL